MRITEDNLRGVLKLLNERSKNEYVIMKDISGYCLFVKSGDGVSRVGFYGTKSDVYYTICTINNYLDKEHKELVI